MMARAGNRDRVIVTVDLRKVDPAAVTSRRFADLQAEQVPDGDPRQVDSSRVVLLDNAADLVAHDEVYAHILDSHVNLSIICLAIGPPAHDDPTIALRRPYQLGPPNVALLWLSDLAGIGWEMESTQAGFVNIAGQAVSGELPYGLLEVLSLPQVFDRVLELAGTMGGATASPGIRVLRGDVPPEILAAAQRSAVQQLTEPPISAMHLRASFDPGGLVRQRGPGPESGRTASVIQRGSPFDETCERGRRASRDAGTAVTRLTRLSGISGPNPDPARRMLREFADSLEELREQVVTILEIADPLTGFDAAHRDRLGQLGVRLDPPGPEAPTRMVEILASQAMGAIDQHQSLPDVAGRLRDESNALVPHGMTAFIERARRSCPPEALARLRKPPQFLAGIAPFGVLAATFLACLLSGAWPRPQGLSAILAFLGTAIVALRLISRAAAVSAVPERARGPFFASMMAASVTGAGIGWAVSGAVRVSAGVGPGIAIGAAVPLVLLTILAPVAWRALGRDWADRLQLGRLLGVPALLHNLVADVAMNEWRLMQERMTASDLAGAVAGMVDDAAASLRAYAGTLPAAGPVKRLSHEQDQVSQGIALIDLSAAISTTLGQLIASWGPAGLMAVDAVIVKDEVAATLSGYRRHLATIGLQEPPWFARGVREREGFVKSLIERGTTMRDLFNSGVTDEQIMQLCAPDHLSLLEVAARSAELIRFAPRAAQPFLGTASPAGSPPSAPGVGREHPIVWTSASPVSGVLRLVPLRPGTVREVVAEAKNEPGPGSLIPESWWPAAGEPEALEAGEPQSWWPEAEEPEGATDDL
jgi:hypothetical protein